MGDYGGRAADARTQVQQPNPKIRPDENQRFCEEYRWLVFEMASLGSTTTILLSLFRSGGLNSSILPPEDSKDPGGNQTAHEH